MNQVRFRDTENEGGSDSRDAQRHRLESPLRCVDNGRELVKRGFHPTQRTQRTQRTQWRNGRNDRWGKRPPLLHSVVYN